MRFVAQHDRFNVAAIFSLSSGYSTPSLLSEKFDIRGEESLSHFSLDSDLSEKGRLFL